MAAKTLLVVAALALLAAPSASAWTAYAYGPIAVSGTASTCTPIAHPLFGAAAWYLTGFAGTINSVPTGPGADVIVALTVGSLSCTPFFGGFSVGGGGTGVAASDP